MVVVVGGGDSVGERKGVGREKVKASNTCKLPSIQHAYNMHRLTHALDRRAAIQRTCAGLQQAQVTHVHVAVPQQRCQEGRERRRLQQGERM